MPLGSNIAVFGGDKRQVYLAKSLILKGYTVYAYQLAEAIQQEQCGALQSLDEMFDQCNVLIGPVPFTQNVMPAEIMIPHFAKLLKRDHVLIGGAIPPALAQFCNEKKTPCHDLMKNERIAILNAVATAEGAIMEAIQASGINLHGSDCLILGYGRCARVLAAKLKGLDANVAVAARSEEALAYIQAAGLRPVVLKDLKERLPACDFVFNTIPSLILDQSCLELVKPDVVIIDIASAPGGVDFNYAQQRKLNAKLCLGLPGKVAPKISADILADEIVKLLKERMVP